ncbi:MAG: FAD-dependent oxidoreductase [Bacteroidota bacterium]
MNHRILEHSFLGELPKKGADCLVIGAGIAGLIMGYHLKKVGIPFQIVERSQRAGGLLDSHVNSFGLAEQAANGFLWCPEIAEVCEDLGLEIVGPEPSAKARYLVRNRKLRKFPLGVVETLAFVGRLLLPHRQNIDTIEDFGHLYFGKTFTNQVLEPAFAGIYGASIQKLSFSGALSPLARIMNLSNHLPLALLKNRMQKKKESTPTTKRTRGTHSFKNGIGSLTSALADFLKEHIEYGVDGLVHKNSDQHLLICTPANVARSFFDGALNDLLNQVEYTPIITTTLVLNKADLAQFKEGFGCLIPRSEGLQILGVLFNSCIFSNRVQSEEWLSVTCIMRDDDPNLRYLKMLDVDIKNLIVKELDSLFGLKKQPLDYRVYRWQRGIPLYSPEMYNQLFQIDALLKEQYPNRSLFGNYTGEIAIRGMFQSAAKLHFNS